MQGIRMVEAKSMSTIHVECRTVRVLLLFDWCT